MLAFDHVTKHRRNRRQQHVVLDGVSFEISAGEHVDLRGPRRNAKTALLRIAAGIDLPDRGTVTSCGKTLTGSERGVRSRILRQIAFVAQSSEWRGTVGVPMIHHIALPLILAGTPMTQAMAAAHVAAEQVDAAAFLGSRPHELPPDVLMRLSLARALVREPRLLVVDAPGDGATDLEQQSLQRHLLERVRERRGMALLVCSREASAWRGADRVMTLDSSGRVRIADRSGAHAMPFPAGAPTP